MALPSARAASPSDLSPASGSSQSGIANADPSDCETCDGFGKIWDDGDNIGGTFIPCEVCHDWRGWK